MDMVMRQIEYTIRDKYNKTHILKFHLYDTTLCDKWVEMIKYYTANRRFHFCDAYCSHAWHSTHETNGDIKDEKNDSV